MRAFCLPALLYLLIYYKCFAVNVGRKDAQKEAADEPTTLALLCFHIEEMLQRERMVIVILPPRLLLIPVVVAYALVVVFVGVVVVDVEGIARPRPHGSFVFCSLAFFVCFKI